MVHRELAFPVVADPGMGELADGDLAALGRSFDNLPDADIRLTMCG